MADEVSKCSKCESASLDTNGFPHWCKACRAKYQREYQALRKEMSETRGFAAGVSAFREHIISRFAAIPADFQFNKSAAIQWISQEQFQSPE